MKRTLIVLALGAMFFMGCTKEVTVSNTESYVEIVARAEKEVTPDTFELTINLSESAKGNISAMEQKMLSALTAVGVDTKADLTVTDMSGDNWYWWRKSQRVIQNKSYLFKTKNTDLLSKVCDELDKIGSLNYNLTKLDYSEIDKLKTEVQQAAVAQARVKANALLSGDNKKAGDLIYLQENQNFNYGMGYQSNIALEAVAKQESIPSPSFQKIKIYFEVTARYTIK